MKIYQITGYMPEGLECQCEQCILIRKKRKNSFYGLYEKQKQGTRNRLLSGEEKAKRRLSHQTEAPLPEKD